MGFFAEGDKDAYPASTALMPGSEEYKKAKAREAVWKDQQEFALREQHGPKTPGYAGNRKAILDMYNERAAAKGPASLVAAKANYIAPSGAGQAVQGSAASMLSTAATGGGPSAAASVAKQGIDDTLRARLAQMAGTRAGSSELANASAGGAAANAMSGAAFQAAAQRSQEQLNAADHLGGVSSAMRSQDIGTAAEANRVALANAGLAQGTSLANQSATMQWQAMSDAEKRATLGMLMGLDQNEMTNRLNYYNFKHGLSNRMQAQSMREQAYQDAQTANLISGAGAAAGYGAKAYAANNQPPSWDTAREDITRR